MGLEATPDEYIAAMVAVFREVRRVLRPDGTCWVNMGDSYATSSAERLATQSGAAQRPCRDNTTLPPKAVPQGLKPKDLLLMPARLALALQADGWWVRSDIIWAKPNPMPESVTDRPTSAHEHVFLLTRSARYYYDAEAVREEAINEGHVVSYDGTQKNTGHQNRTYPGCKPRDILVSGRNLRNVWSLATEAFPGAHFATYPTELAARCVKAGTKPGDMILDPFAGAGTTLLVADRLQRHAIGIELNADYAAMAEARIASDSPLFVDYGDAPVPEPPEDARMADLFAWAAD